MGKRRFLIVVSDRSIMGRTVYGTSYYPCGDPYAVFLWKLNNNVVCVANPVVRAIFQRSGCFCAMLLEKRRWG